MALADDWCGWNSAVGKFLLCTLLCQQNPGLVLRRWNLCFRNCDEWQRLCECVAWDYCLAVTNWRHVTSWPLDRMIVWQADHVTVGFTRRPYCACFVSLVFLLPETIEYSDGAISSVCVCVVIPELVRRVSELLWMRMFVCRGWRIKKVFQSSTSPTLVSFHEYRDMVQSLKVLSDTRSVN